MATNLRILPPADLHYVELAMVASGAEADVYTATYVRTSEKIAIKVLRLGPGPESLRERSRARFVNEARQLRTITHPNVARVFEMLDVELRGQATDAFVMEWLPETLRDLVGRHTEGLSLDALERVVHDSLSGLGALHDAGVAVRDLRPENLLLSAGHVLKVADLGMARTADFVGSLVDQSSQYQAPEVLDGTLWKSYGKEAPPTTAHFRSDIYSLGCILYEAAVGSRAWTSLAALQSVYDTQGIGSGLQMEQRWQAWHKDRHQVLPPVGTVRPELPEALSRAIDGMIKKEPSQRLGGVKDVLAVLRKPDARSQETTSVGRQVGQAPPARPPGFWKHRSEKVKRGLTLAAAAVALLAAIGLGLPLLRHRAATMTVIPDGVADLEVYWQGALVTADPGTQIFRLKPATHGKLVILSRNAKLLETTLSLPARVQREVDVRERLPGRLRVIVNVPAEIVVNGDRQIGRTADFELPAGVYVCTVTASGYSALATEVHIGSAEAQELPVALVAAPETGHITIAVEPPGLSAHWQLRGPNGAVQAGAGATTLRECAPGTYLITWSTHAGFHRPRPASERQNLVAGGEIEFGGTYGRAEASQLEPQPRTEAAPRSITEPAERIAPERPTSDDRSMMGLQSGDEAPENDRRAFLGVTGQDMSPSMARALGLDGLRGVIVNEVIEDMPAARAGLRAGDVIVSVSGKATDTFEALRRIMRAAPVGLPVRVVLMRDGKNHEIEVVPGPAPEDANVETTLAGVSVQPLSELLPLLGPDALLALGLSAASKGLRVTSVDAASAAAREGLAGGDIIVEINRLSVNNPEDLATALARTPDRPVLIQVYRPQEKRRVFIAVPRGN